MISNVSEISFLEKADGRGKLIALESSLNIPFDIKRVYYLYDSNVDGARGFHAHIKLRQVLLCVSGSCKVHLESSAGVVVHELNSPSHGLLVEGVVWREMKNFSKDCVLLVLASELYDEQDYIHDHDQFKNILFS